MPDLQPTAFSLLLRAIDANEERAASAYEELRFRLTQIMKWKGCLEPDADALADEVLDRVARKIEQGEMIDNVKAYATSVARFVLLEHTRKRRELGVDELPEVPVLMDTDAIDGPDLRIQCLRKCLVEVSQNEADQRLIVGYYDNASDAKKKEIRRQLADQFGLTPTALKVKACRLRAKLEQCINECVARVTKPMSVDTYHRGEPAR
jgi:DNA-directed RNA polymerase specialized sigma24 family protein